MPTILVADDNSNIQKMVSLVFKEKGIKVVAVGNGEAACRKVPEVHPDVVLADVFMPVRNGYEVCEFVKQDPQFAETPVILLVGAFDPLDEKEAQRVGANGVLKKPFVPPEPLVAMVSSLLKLEPPVEEPPPAPIEAAAPVAPAIAPPPVREFPATTPSEDYSDADELATSFGDPVATPAKNEQEAEEEEDSEPASEWARRRATMDYEIDASDSADMVEKLAAQGTTEETEIQAKHKRLPFGGANIPGMPNDDVPASSPSSSAWPEPEAEVSAEPQSSVSPSAPITEEFLPPIIVEEQKTSTDMGDGTAPKFEEAEIEPPPTLMRVPPPKNLEIITEPAITDAVDAPETTRVPAFDTLPEIHIAAPTPDFEAPPKSDPFEPFSEPEKIPTFLAEESAALSFAQEAPVLPSPTYSEADASIAEEENAQPILADVEAGTKQGTSKTAVDQATVDDVVAKVISKLEPQLHQALANGILRPLVEELLNQQREKK